MFFINFKNESKNFVSFWNLLKINSKNKKENEVTIKGQFIILFFKEIYFILDN